MMPDSAKLFLLLHKFVFALSVYKRTKIYF